MRQFFTPLFIVSTFITFELLTPDYSVACDAHQVRNVIEPQFCECGEADGCSHGFTLAVTEQFTSFSNLQTDGIRIDNPLNERLTSSVTQFIAGYNVLPQLGVQVSLPHITRDFRQIQDGSTVEGRRSGIGDLTLLASYAPFAHKDADSSLTIKFAAGLKLPTGNSDELNTQGSRHHHEVEAPEMEEAHHVEAHMEEEAEHHHAKVNNTYPLFHAGHHHDEAPALVSGIHGHELALGSGSIDYVLGVGVNGHSGYFLGFFNLGYTLRTEGDFDYRFANDITWSAGPGIYLIQEEEHSLALVMNMTGTYKEEDVINGQKQNDTALATMLLGPGFLFSIGQHISGDLGVDIPVSYNTTGTQIVPDYRLRAGITGRF